jgi:fibronectin-binding autotransporter adhesin
LNYTGKFDSKLSADGAGLHSHFNGDAHVQTFSQHATHAPSDAIIIPDAQLLFNGDFKRSGVDLVLTKDDHELVLHDYFKGEKRAALSSPDGAHLTGDIVNALTGHVEYAQADGSAGAGKVIGHVTKLTGTATAVRNGVSVILNNGDNVEKGDVVQSGSDSTLGITFIDGTVFGLSANARMVLNEMVYDPNGSSNSSLLSLVAGTITFVAGETAKHGDMKIDTPVATMGIRGTAVLVEIDFSIPLTSVTPSTDPSIALPTAKFQVLVEPDGTTGSYILFDKQTLTPLITVDKAGQFVSFNNGAITTGNALLSPDVQKLITDVFALNFTDNTNTKSFHRHADPGHAGARQVDGRADRHSVCPDRDSGQQHSDYKPQRPERPPSARQCAAEHRYPRRERQSDDRRQAYRTRRPHRR